RERLRRRDITSLELTDAHIAAVEQARALNAFVKETPDHARDMARASDVRLAKGEGGPLEGIPLGIKDLFATKGVRTTACSKILDEFTPGSSNETSCFGPVVNPWRRRGSNVGAGAGGQIEGAHLVPGGSSGGSAAAVAARLCLGATATDTGGSIRQPAAFTGTVGLKPT